MTDPIRGQLLAKLKNLSTEFAQTLAQLEELDVPKPPRFVCLVDEKKSLYTPSPRRGVPSACVRSQWAIAALQNMAPGKVEMYSCRGENQILDAMRDVSARSSQAEQTFVLFTDGDDLPIQNMGELLKTLPKARLEVVLMDPKPDAMVRAAEAHLFDRANVWTLNDSNDSKEFGVMAAMKHMAEIDRALRKSKPFKRPSEGLSHD